MEGWKYKVEGGRTDLCHGLSSDVRKGHAGPSHTWGGGDYRDR